MNNSPEAYATLVVRPKGQA